MKTADAMAERTPMSRTRAARSPKAIASSPGRPNSLTRVAPGAENRSVIVEVMAALCSAASRSRAPTRRPTRRAGMMKTGRRTTASSVMAHDRRSMTASVSTRAITLVTTPPRAEVNARWAPMTSLLSRLTRAPVWVRVKKAMGMPCTCSNTRRRRSRIRPSPSRDELSRSSSPMAVSARATSAMAAARPTTTRDTGPVHDRVDGLAGEDGRGHAEHGRDRGQREEGGHGAPVGAGELSDPAEGFAAHPLAGPPVVLHGASQRHPGVHVAHGRAG